MSLFYYQIKGKKATKQDLDTGYFYADSHWVFPPVFTDIIEAENRKSALSIIEEMYGRKFPTRILAKDLSTNEFLLSCKEIKKDDYHTKRLIEVNICQQCNSQFKMIEKYQQGETGGGYDFCSRICANEHRESQRLKEASKFELLNGLDGIHPPVIYKITNKLTNKIYIGKTTQAFTFRWYQHFFQSKKSTDFHKAIRDSKLTDWVFEIVEQIAIPENLKTREEINRHILSVESNYIRKYDSINNGYNSVVSIEVSIQESLSI